MWLQHDLKIHGDTTADDGQTDKLAERTFDVDFRKADDWAEGMAKSSDSSVNLEKLLS